MNTELALIQDGKQYSFDLTGRRNKKKRDVNEKEDSLNFDETHELPYEIKESAEIGRYFVAARDLGAGEEILKDQALVVGPSQDGGTVCIGCYTPMSVDSASASYRCSSCFFPLCSSKCKGKGKRTGHSNEECALFSRSSIRNLKSEEVLQYFSAITPLRCLNLRHTNSKAWEIVSKMEAHTEVRRGIKTIWEHNQKNVVEVIRKAFCLEDFSEEIIHQVCGVLEVNAFEVGQGLRALFGNAYLFAHDCVPNTRHADSPNFDVTFWTTVPVTKGSRLNATYTFIIQGTLGRRKHLLETKFFECNCLRCQDPTELGTNISALMCPLCRKGLVKPRTPLDRDSDWICDGLECPGYVTTAVSVNKLTQNLFITLDSIDGNDIPAYECFILEHSSMLYEKHYLCLSALHCLFQLYGKIDGYLITDLTDEQLKRKVDICKILLDVFETLEPGISKQKGLLYYEIQAPLMMLLQRKCDLNKVGKLEMKNKLREISNYLEGSIKMLDMEPDQSPESEIATAAKEALSNLSNWKELLAF